MDTNKTFHDYMKSTLENIELRLLKQEKLFDEDEDKIYNNRERIGKLEKEFKNRRKEIGKLEEEFKNRGEEIGKLEEEFKNRGGEETNNLTQRICNLETQAEKLRKVITQIKNSRRITK